jgi:hypothetical protein
MQPVEGVSAWDLAFGRAGNRHPVGCRSRVVRQHPALWTIEYTSLVQAAEGCPETLHVSAGAIERAIAEAIGSRINSFWRGSRRSCETLAYRYLNFLGHEFKLSSPPALRPFRLCPSQPDRIPAPVACPATPQSRHVLLRHTMAKAQ